MTRFARWTVIAAICPVAWLALAGAGLPAAEIPPAGDVVRFDDAAHGPTGSGVSVVPAALAAQPGEYWIGVEAHEVPEALRAHTTLPKDQGLLVEQVYPDSPAAKAKIARHDVLLKAGDKPLRKVADLVEAVQAAKGKKLVLEAVRAGKTLTLEVTPEKRPKDVMPPGGWGWGWGGATSVEEMKKWIESMKPWPGGPAMRFRLFHPGAVLPPGTILSPPLPGNMTVIITKQGDQPAKIHVQRDDQKWDLTEKELDKLPADIRPHVERMLGWGVGPWLYGGWIDFVPAPGGPGKAEPKGRVAPKPLKHPEQPAKGAGAVPPGLEKRLDELDQRLQKLQKSVDELRERSAETKPPKLQPAK